jgi:hypothetical protein
MAAGLGFKTFTTGEVLTAGDVNGYLMQGILVFASAAARDSAITSPQEGQACYLKDTNAVLTYSGSAWVNIDTTGATGLTLINTTSFSGVSSFSLAANTFSSTYLNYKIILNLDITATSSELNMRMRASGTDNTSANYVYARHGVKGENNSAYLNGSGTSLATSWLSIPVSGTYPAFQVIDIISPFSTDYHTGFNVTGMYVDSVASNYCAATGSGILSVNTSYDSMTIYSPTMTGVYSVYGYNK